jgi:hypothetical protein
MTREEVISYAADHALMTWQREERKATGRPMRTGDFMQAHTGGKIVVVDEHEGAGDHLLRKANERAQTAREKKGDEQWT